MSISFVERINRVFPNGRPTKPIELNIIHTPKVYGYIRVSTTDQAREGVSMAAQEELIKEYCNTKNLPEPIIYSDPAISGRYMENRPKFLEMVSLLKKDDTLIAYSLSRIGRNTRQILDFVERMQEKGVKIICLKENFDFSTENGKFLLTIMAGVNQLEVGQTSQRVKDAMTHLKREGKLRTKPHYGWKYLVQDGKRELIEVPEEQAVINYILLLITENKNITTSEIVRLINKKIDDGELHYRNGKYIYNSIVDSIITHNNLRG